MTKRPRAPRSIRRDLLTMLVTVVAVAWTVTGVVSYVDARRQLGALLDAHLAHTASLLMVLGGHGLAEVGVEHPAPLHRYSQDVSFQIWENGSVLRAHSVSAPKRRLSPTAEGFSDVTIDGDRWRVFGVWDRGRRLLVQAGERYVGRDELATAIAADLALPFALALPVLGMLVWASVGRGMKRLTAVSHQVAAREPDNLAPLTIDDTPVEVVPLVENLNRLFVRVGALLEHERRFTADAAHELRTPLAGIRAQAQVARGTTQDADRIHALDRVMLGSDRAARLVDQLLTLARVDRDDMQATRRPCDLRAVLAAAIAEIAPAALSKDVEIVSLDNGPVWVFGDSALLQVLCRNLLENAVRYSPLRTVVRAEVTQTDARALVIVTDEGRGVRAEELQHLGRRFYRAPGTPESGSGLGLSIVTRVAELHGGTITFEPSPATHGLRVTVSLRRHHGDAAQLPAK